MALLLRVFLFVTLLCFGFCQQLLDEDYPGTATLRRDAVEENARRLSGQLSATFPVVRKSLLAACGLRDDSDSIAGRGRTSHCFADRTHLDCCTVVAYEQDNINDVGVLGIARQNLLGPGMRASSLPVGETSTKEGGSWCTCQGQTREASLQLNDVCHKQFRARVGFKAVWCPFADHSVLALVSDEGELLASGKPVGKLPPKSERIASFAVVKGSRFETACPAAAAAVAMKSVDEL